MDEMKQLVWESEIAYGVLGRAGEFVLVPLVGEGGDGAQVASAIAKGYRFCGVVAARDNVPAAICEPDQDNLATMLNAGTAFAVIIAERIRREREQKPDGWLTFITKLSALQDDRT